MKNIPVHQLKDRVGLAGIEISRFKAGDLPENDETLGAHRDDHYLFFLLEEGEASLMIDFQEVAFSTNTLYYVLPGQVHHRVNNEIAYGWFLAVDPMLISPDYRSVFENQLLLQQPCLLDAKQMQQFRNLLNILHEKYSEDERGPFYVHIVHSLLQSFIGMVARNYGQVNWPGVQLTRPVQLSQQFKKMLSENMRSIKSPSAYASKLHVSESYLNESLKKTTGFPVSYWIMQEVMMEAKRLLYYSELNVKEIAHDLGYDDHTYFSRLFKKTVEATPLDFRHQYRK
ncbi:helix-turn-helix domain-containing protein [Mucilaginibacter agri]|uniref:Helix-turn-helix domain-containing protein n=1 Tax=Mucilaginibacter agri TaxID=2695265 RepID=A0A966DTH1_9SPHI|nr:AraC family transcriptional regulator [Mucilaginibacter agri]NCD68679.1 helix-turn-helix domain-containing protein [Mucilaginibacter agri]